MFRYAMAFAFMSVGCVLNWPCAVAIQAKTFSEYVFQGFGIDIGHTWTYVVKKLIELTLICKENHKFQEKFHI